MNASEFIQLGKKRLADVGLVDTLEYIENGHLLPQIPGLGFAGDGISFTRNREALSQYYVQTRLIGEDFLPSTVIDLFGETLTTPILAAPMSGIATNLRGLVNEEEFQKMVTRGCVDAGTLGACGDSYDTTSEYISAETLRANKGVAVLKPRASNEIKERIEILKKINVVAIGLDLDGVTGLLLESRRVGRKNVQELRNIRSLFAGPMFLKGILSVEDATMAHDAGFDAIVISNHGGRSVDYCPAPASILPAIAKKFKGKMRILVDGGVKNGYDVFMYLALGADAVMVGRTILYGALGGGRNGVSAVISQLTSDLVRAMVMTGNRSIKDIRSDSIKMYV